MQPTFHLHANEKSPKRPAPPAPPAPTAGSTDSAEPELSLGELVALLGGSLSG